MLTHASRLQNKQITNTQNCNKLKREGFHSKENRDEIWTHMTANNRNIKLEQGPNLIICNSQQ